MDAWDHIRRAVQDDRSGSLAVAERAAAGLAGLTTRRDRVRAGRALVRAHPAMGLVRRVVDEATRDGDPRAFVEHARAQAEAAADGARWLVTKRNTTVLTHSNSGAIALALARVRSKIGLVLCTVSLPGGEGRAFARKLARDGFSTEVVPDAAIARACADADLALVGADAITPNDVINKVGTTLVALAAREAGVACYALGCSAKMVREVALDDRFERTPLELFDATVTERGALRPSGVRRAVSREVR